MTTGVYLAGASAEAERVRMWAKALELTGSAHVTMHWFEGAEQWSGQDSRLPLLDQRDIASKNWEAIRRSQIIWYFSPLNMSEGASIELGMALAHNWHFSGMRSVVSGATFNRCLYSSMATVRMAEDAQAFMCVRKWLQQLKQLQNGVAL